MTINLAVKISKPSSGVYYYLKADTIEHSIIRMPTQSPLPSEQDAASPNVYGMDLNMCIQQINISGLIDEVADLSTNTPSKYDLETVAITWTHTDLTTDYKNAINLTIGSQVFYCAIKSLTFRKSGGLEDRWEYALILLHYSGSSST